MKILFTSVGRRVELIQCFRNAAKSLDYTLEIVGIDTDLSSPALQFCDVTEKAIPISDDNYINYVLKLCVEHNIDAVIPTIDTDLLKLSMSKSLFEKQGIKLIISSYDKVKLCRDKNLTTDYFKCLGLDTPNMTKNANEFFNSFPAFIKPKDGSSSINTHKVNDFEELDFWSRRIKGYILQEFIDGDEYTVDIFCDLLGNPIYITPRKRLSIRAGEVLKTEICMDEQIIREMKILIDDFKPCGQITVQLIKEKYSGVNYYIEINPRFGGGAPLSIKAGADSAKALLMILNGKHLTYVKNAAEDGAIYSRFDQSVRI